MNMELLIPSGEDNSSVVITERNIDSIDSGITADTQSNGFTVLPEELTAH